MPNDVSLKLVVYVLDGIASPSGRDNFQNDNNIAKLNDSVGFSSSTSNDTSSFEGKDKVAEVGVDGHFFEFA